MRGQASEEELEKSRPIQRDLEDQIEEEYKAMGMPYQRTETNNSNNMSTSRPPIVVQDVLELLKRGYTRLTKHDLGYGSIQAHYNLSSTQVKELFSHPKLKMKKTIAPKAALNIVDQDQTDAQTNLEIIDNLDVIIKETIQDVEVKKESVNKEELFD